MSISMRRNLQLDPFLSLVERENKEVVYIATGSYSRKVCDQLSEDITCDLYEGYRVPFLLTCRRGLYSQHISQSIKFLVTWAAWKIGAGISKGGSYGWKVCVIAS